MKVLHNKTTIIAFAAIILLVATGVWLFRSQLKTSQDEKQTLQNRVTALEDQILTMPLSNQNITPSPLPSLDAKQAFMDIGARYMAKVPEGYVVGQSRLCEGGCGYYAQFYKKTTDVAMADIDAKIEALTGDSSLTLDSWIMSWKRRFGERYCDEPTNCEDKGTVTIGGVTARKIIIRGQGATVNYLFIKGDIAYIFTTNPSTTPSELEHTILGTFQFTD